MIFAPKKNIYFPNRNWGMKKYQRGILHTVGFFADAGGAGPTVSARADGRTNARTNANCYSGIQFHTDGTEYEYSATGSVTNSTTWLDTGSSSDVWVEWDRTSGTLSDWNSLGSGNENVRLNLGTTRSFRIIRSTTGTDTILGFFDFWDASSGGNNLQTTSTVTWSAERIFDGCPTCCFTPWTLITMADGSTMPIVAVRVGDLIKVVGGIEPVTEIITREFRVMHLVKFADGRVLEMSEDHPLYVDGKGYAAVNPDPNIDYKDLGVAETLVVGDKVLDERGQLNEIVSIDDMDYPETVYTFENSKFYANGILVY